MIAIQQLDKYYGQNRVLNQVSLEVQRGEVCVLLGPSGGGKSTLLRTINGLETFDSGCIQVGEVQLLPKVGKERDAALRQIRKSVGMVFQQFNLFPHRTVLQNITEAPIHVLKQNVEEARIAALQFLDRVGLKEKADQYPRSLSGGQQQRVAIARTLAMRPEVILFDEPTSALDPQMTREVVGVMTDLAQAGQTMIVVTHGLGFARDVADQVHILSGGTIVETGSSAAVFENPQSEVTKRFLRDIHRI